MSKKCELQFRIKLDEDDSSYDPELESKLVCGVDWEVGRIFSYQEVFNVFDGLLKLHDQFGMDENCRIFKAWKESEGQLPRYEIGYEYENEETAVKYSDSLLLIEGDLLPGHGLPAYDGLCFTLEWELDEE